MPVASACAPAKPYRQGDAHADPAPGSPAPARSKLYNPRHPERTVLYRAVAGHLQTWLALSGAGQVDGQGDQQPPLTYVVSGRKPLFLKNCRSQNSELAVVFSNCHARKGSGVHFRGRHARCCVFRARVAPDFCNPVVKKGLRPRFATRPACRSCLGRHSSSSSSRALARVATGLLQCGGYFLPPRPVQHNA